MRETLLQLWTPDEVRGRVNAVNSVFVSASNELGEFRAGTMAHAIGPAAIGAIPAVGIGGVGAVAVAGIWALRAWYGRFVEEATRVLPFDERNFLIVVAIAVGTPS